MNRLQFESSPYLQQHAHNPVDWYPWGDEAFAKAKAEQKPVLISIGYAACHWCHVMERESFEDAAIAAYMNEHFVNIKVDREERPDVDHLYMDALQMMTGQGGWPLNMFATPDRKPFYGGTYFPPKRVYQRASWIEVLEAVRLSWEQKQLEVEMQSEQLIQHLSQSNIQETGNELLPFYKKDFAAIIDALLQQADEQWGGFGMAPKFPQTMSLQFLLQYYYASDDEKAFNHVRLSLDKMLAGGIYDQLGGGLARYSTDAEWLAPHFEKMLYDNALLLELLADAFQISKQAHYEVAIRQTIDFCLRELSIDAAGIGFYAALDADSEGEEGKFYTWHYEEILALLPDIDPSILEYWNISPDGNWEGKTILNYSNIDAEWQSKKGVDFEQKLEQARQILFEARAKRERPLTDTKILLSWNALMVQALIKCGKALKEEAFLNAAKNNLDFLLNTFYKEGKWYRNYNGTQLSIAATLEDLAYLIRTLFTAGEHLHDYIYIHKAKTLMEYVDEHFSDEDNKFYYFNNKEQKDIVIRKVETYDGAQPSVNAIMAENNLMYSKWFESTAAQERVNALLKSILSKAKRYPGSFGYWNMVLLRNVTQKTLVIDAGVKSINALEYWPQVIIALKQIPITAPIPLLSNKPNGLENAAYYCSQEACFEPTLDIESIFLKIKLDKMLE